MKILIADKLSKVGLDWLAEQKDVEIGRASCRERV